MSAQQNNQTALRGRVLIKGTLVFTRADGSQVSIPMEGSAPLAPSLGISEEAALELVRQHQQQQTEK